jgi:ketosteroid isomerase-like protein
VTWTAIVSLHVTAGEDVAFACALLRCGTPEEHEAKPENRLRPTLGLRKESGRWIVSHEHHSSPSEP